MVKNNKKPRLRFKGFTDEWEQRKLGEIVEFYSGLTYKPNDIVDDDKETLVLRSCNVQNGEVIENDNVYVTSGVVNSKNVSQGDIIVVVRNGSRDLIGKHAVIKRNMLKTVIGAFMTGISSKYPNFVNSLLSTNQFFIEIEKNLGATINQITIGNFAKMNFTIPIKFDEKIKIGKMFLILDNLITLHQRKYDKLLNVKKALLDKMFPKNQEKTPKIRFKGFFDAWEQRKLGEIGDFKSNGVDKLSKPNEINVNLLNYMDVYNRRKITNKSASLLMQVTARPNQIKENNVLKGDVFFTPTSETADDIGHVMVIEENIKNTVYSYHLMRYRPHKNNFYLTFPNYCLDTYFVRKQMELSAQGVQRFVINRKQFEDLEIRLPSIEEQRKIAVTLTKIDNLITLHQSKCEKLKNIKKALLDKMFV